MRKVEVDITVECETHTMTEWAKILKMNRHTFRMRYLRGLRGEALVAPLEPRKPKEKIISIRTAVHIEDEAEQETQTQDQEVPVPYPQRLLTYKGKTKTLKDWSRITGIQFGTVLQRYKANKTPEQILAKIDPTASTHANQRLLTYKGETLNMTKWANRYSIPLSTALYRHARHELGKITTEEVLFGIKNTNTKHDIAQNLTDYRLRQLKQRQADQHKEKEDALQAYKDNVAWIKGEKIRRDEPQGFVWQNTGHIEIAEKDIPEELRNMVNIFKAPKAYDEE
jgi:hypothetical protein